MRKIHVCKLILATVLTLVALLPAPAAAQNSAIAGVVRDVTGGVLPGVTVEASSPALIERARVVVTDGAGQYRVITLPPGVYTVTFSLPGFSTVVREGIELTTNFTANVNAELRVGSVEESITVSGASPVVDIQSATQQQQLGRAVLDAIPTGRSLPSIGKVLPGIVTNGIDVGGSEGMQTQGMTVHGSGAGRYQIDGMTVQSGIGAGTAAQYWNDAMFEEFTYQTSAMPAEVDIGGVRVMMTPKEGGNAFSGHALGQLATWGSDNFTDDLKARGLGTPDKILEIWDQDFALGGPVKRDRLWFFFSQRYWGVNQLVAETSYRDPRLCTDIDWATSKRERKYGCQGIDDNWIYNYIGRLTLQATPRNKVSAFYSKENKYRGKRELQPGVSPEATTQQIMNLSYSFQAKWVSPITNRLLWEAGLSQYFLNYDFDYQPVVGPNDRPHTDLLLQQTWGARPGGFFNRNNHRRFWNLSLSYVTGSHAFKTGFQWSHGPADDTYDRYLGHTIQEYRAGVPASVVVDNTPLITRARMKKDIGVYVQDSWTIDRLTINPGVRFSYYEAGLAAQSNPAGRWVPAREFPAVESLPTFTNVSPRVSAVYDLFGDAKTAIKASPSEYIEPLGHNYAERYNPSFVDTDRRTWADLNGDDLAQDNEVGPAAKSSFGIKAALRPDPEKLKRQRDWEYTVSLQHELRPGMSAQIAYIRRVFMDIRKSDNLLVDPVADYTLVPIPDPRGNGETITIYNLSSTKFGLTDVLDYSSETNRRYWDGIELTANGRLPNGGTVFGGYTLGGASQMLCDVDDPNQLRYCDRSEPWLGQIKFGGAYLLPLDLQLSGTFVSFPGENLGVNYNVNRTVLRSLTGRTLTQTQVVVPLDDPSDPDRRLDRVSQVDLRVAKVLRVGQRRVTVQFDMFNVFNANTVLAEVQTFGPALAQAREMIKGRLFQLGAQLHF